MFRLTSYTANLASIRSFIIFARVRAPETEPTNKRPDKKLTAYKFILNEKPIKKPTNNNNKNDEVKQYNEKATATTSEHEENEE